MLRCLIYIICSVEKWWENKYIGPHQRDSQAVRGIHILKLGMCLPLRFQDKCEQDRNCTKSQTKQNH